MARTLICSTLSALLLSSRLLAQDASATVKPPFTIAPPTYDAFVGTLLPLETQVAPSKSSNVNDRLGITWHSSDPLTAWIDDDGVAVLLNPGTVTISARQGTRTASREIHVRANPVRSLTLEATPAKVAPGEVVRIVAEARDEEGRAVARARPNYSLIGEGASVDGEGRFVARMPGTFMVVAELGGASTVRRLEVGNAHAVQQGVPAGVKIDLESPRYAPYAGTTVTLGAKVRGAGGVGRQTPRPRWTVSDTSVARVDENGTVLLLRPGRVEVQASLGGARTSETIHVLTNPIADAALRVGDADVRVGERVQVSFDAWVRGGRRLDNPHVLYAVSTAGGSTTSATISDGGVFTAREPGVYTIVAAVGNRADRVTVLVRAQ